MSRVVGALVIFGLLFGPIALAIQTGISLDGWRIAALSIASLGLYFIAWIKIVRLKPWTPWQYWLPNSRIVGYSVYLGLPLVAIVLVLFLATHFKWGM